MDYIGVTFKSKTGVFDWDILVAFLGELGYDNFEETDSELIAYIQEGKFDARKIDNVLSKKIKNMDIWYNYETISDRNWNEVWESNYDAVVIADRCMIRAPFHKADDRMEFDIVIEPQMSFGTAHHETTSMMIEYILEAELIGKSILDMGCGTGVLGILASRKGAKEIEAIDNDEWAYKNSAANIKKNHIENMIVKKGDANSIKNKYDIIFANINLNILISDMSIYANALMDGGIIYFSGFYQADLKKLNEEAENNKLRLVNFKEKQNWTAAQFKKIF